MPTIPEMTRRYNKMSVEMGLPPIKKLKPTKEYGSATARFNHMRKQHKEWSEQKPEIQPTRPGTAIHTLISGLISGGSISDLHNYMHKYGHSWTEKAIRAAVAWDVPKKGYTVGSHRENECLFYKINNSDSVL